jgi:transposase InsO family protein
VGWQFAGHMRTDLVLDALRMALTRRDAGADVQLIHHSDAGSQPRLKRSSQRRCVVPRRVGARALSVIDLVV